MRSELYNSRPATIAALALSLLIGFGSAVSHARQGVEEKSGSSNMGMVDLEKVYEASDSPQLFAQTAAQIESDAQARADAIGAVPQLTDAELKEYGDLVGKKTPTPAEKNRMEELKGFSDSRAQRIRDLETKKDADLSPADKKLLATAAQQRRQFDRMLTVLQADLQHQIVEREESYKRELVSKLRLAVSKVAREKKIDHVFDITAMVCSSNDITQTVIQKLKKDRQ